MSPERAERIAYLTMLSDGEHPIELRRRATTGAWFKDFCSTPGQADEVAHARITQGYDVYVGMAPRVDNREHQREYAPCQALWADLDTERSVRMLDGFEPEPSAVVLSGGIDGAIPKRHATWGLAAPLAASEVKRHLKRLAHHLDADPNCTDVAHVLRLPGSRSYKTGRVARLDSFTGEAHTLEEITGDLADAPDWRADGQPRAAKSTGELVDLFCSVHVEPGRHDAFRRVVGVLLARCDRMPPDVLLELAVCWAQAGHTQPCRDRRELERNFDNLLDQERRKRGLA